METIIEWYQAENEEACKYIVQRISRDQEIFLGDFIKAIIKINNVAAKLKKLQNYKITFSFRKIKTNSYKYIEICSNKSITLYLTIYRKIDVNIFSIINHNHPCYLKISIIPGDNWEKDIQRYIPYNYS